MLIRVVIVLLVVLNLGTGLWWMLRPPTREQTVAAEVPGIALLQIVGESETNPAPRAAAATLAAAPTPVAFAPAQCASFGPFATIELAQAAQARIAAPTVRASLRAVAASGRGWRVIIPPAPDAVQARGIAALIGSAGFTDYFVMREGADTNAIALGRYGSETAARRRAQSLIDAGFNARAEPIGAATHWLDVGTDAATPLPELRARSGASQQQPLACDALTAASAG